MSNPAYGVSAPVSLRASLRAYAMARIAVGRALIDDCSFEQASTAIIAHALRGGEPAHVITPNAQHIVLLEKDKELQDIYSEADLIIPDGISLVMAARFYGRSLKQRVAGVDLFKEVCGLTAKSDLHVFLLGGRPGSAESSAAVLRKDYPGFKCTVHCPPMGFEQSPEGLKKTAEAITAARPDILFVALGAPKQEYWIHHHGLKLSVPVCMGVGGSFEMVGGVVARAPKWAQDIGCEWLYRLCREPRRMWRRYLIGNLEFAAIVLRQRIRRFVFNAFVGLVRQDRFHAELSELILGASQLLPPYARQSPRAREEGLRIASLMGSLHSQIDKESSLP